VTHTCSCLYNPRHKLVYLFTVHITGLTFIMVDPRLGTWPGCSGCPASGWARGPRFELARWTCPVARSRQHGGTNGLHRRLPCTRLCTPCYWVRTCVPRLPVTSRLRRIVQRGIGIHNTDPAGMLGWAARTSPQRGHGPIGAVSPGNRTARPSTPAALRSRSRRAGLQARPMSRGQRVDRGTDIVGGWDSTRRTTVSRVRSGRAGDQTTCRSGPGPSPKTAAINCCRNPCWPPSRSHR